MQVIKMGFKLLVLVLLIKIVAARIRLDVHIDENRDVTVSYKGSETRIITDDDINSFKLGQENLLTALEVILGRRPNNAYLRSPTPWGDLYKSYNWEPVKRVLYVKSAKILNIVMNPVIVLTQDSENPSSHNIKVNTGLSRVVENSLTTSWSTEKEIELSQDVEYEINIGVAKAGGRAGFAFTATMGVNEEISKKETIGATSNVELELKPGEAVTTVLSATVGYIEVEVVHEADLIGTIATNYNPTYNGHHFHHVPAELLTYGGIKHVLTTTETVRINFYLEAQLRVYDKNTGLLI